jgi:hypothetical protein
MTVIAVPYHLDEYLPDLDLPLEPAEVVTAESPPGAPWERLAVLYDAVAGHRPGGRARRRLQLAPGPRGGPARRCPAGPDPGVTALV